MIQYNYDYTVLTAFIILIVSFGFLVIVNLVYWVWMRSRVPLAFRILALLILNELFVVSGELLPFINTSVEILCTFSLLIKVGFTIATKVWVCFIASILYFSKVNPGMNIKIGHYIGKRIIITYIPSISAVVLLFFLATINETSNNIEECWRSLSDGSVVQYLIYTVAFILPSAISVGIISVFMVLYYRIRPRPQKFNWFLVFPISQLIFSSYFLALKIYLLIDAKGLPNGQIINLLQPFLYGLIFTFLLIKQKRDQLSILNTEITLDQSIGDLAH